MKDFTLHRTLYKLTTTITLNYLAQNRYKRIIIIIKWCIRYIFFETKLQKSGDHCNSASIVIHREFNRTDISMEPQKTSRELKIDRFIIVQNFNFKIKKLIRMISSSLPLIHSSDRIFVIVAAHEYEIIYDELMKFFGGRKINCIFHNEKQYWEGMYCIAANEVGLSTYHIFHGYSRDTGKKITLSNINPINYIEQLAKHQVCWGKVHMGVVKKYARHDIKHYPIGKPSLMCDSTNKNANGKILNHLVLLDSAQLPATNKILLDIFSGLQNAGLKPHPDDPNEYKGLLKNINDSIGPRTIIWGCNSSAVLQYGRGGFQINLIYESDFLKDINQKYKRESRNYCSIIEYSWCDFINYTHEKYYNSLSLLLENNLK